jgi:long-chain acyl-CoA synthetase
MATFIPPVLPGEVIFMTGYSPKEIVRRIQSRRVSVLVSVPRILEVLREYLLNAVPESADPPPAGANWMRRWWHYRRVHDLLGWKFWCFVVGAAPLDSALEEFWSKLGFLVVQGYGLTETAPIVTLNHPFHPSKGSVGKPIGGVEVRIAEDGEIVVRGANVTAGYYANEQATAFTEDGWFHTGDIGSIDEEGRVFVRGRKKEMIVTPEGLNVFPEDVESILNTVTGVRDSAVVGLTRDGREQAHAVLVLEPGFSTDDVLAHANRRLESHQQIRGASLWTEGALPRTEGTQKLKRVALRDWVAGTAVPPGRSSPSAALLARYSDDTPLAQLGLSSLDRVELMMQSDRIGSGAVTEQAFAQAATVGDLRRLSADSRATAAEPILFPRWNRNLPARLLRRIALPLLLLPLLRIFVWLRVSGREQLNSLEGPVLFAVNHQSVFDVPAVLAAMPSPWRYRTQTAMGMDWFRAHFHPQGRGWLDRFGNGLQYYLVCLFFNGFPLPQHEAGAREAIRYIGDLVSDDWAVLIFPEGLRTQTGAIAPFRPGVAMMASQLGVRVVPVRIEGLDRVLHQRWKWPRPGRVHVSFGDPMEIRGDDYSNLAQQVEQAVRALPPSTPSAYDASGPPRH